MSTTSAAVDNAQQSGSVMLPVFGGRRGHPTLFDWSLAAQVPNIPPDCGLNWLVNNVADCIREVAVNDDSILLDLDTPADFEAVRLRIEEHGAG